MRPFRTDPREYYQPKKSVFSKIVDEEGFDRVRPKDFIGLLARFRGYPTRPEP